MKRQQGKIERRSEWSGFKHGARCKASCTAPACRTARWRVRVLIEEGTDGKRRFLEETLQGTAADADAKRVELLKRVRANRLDHESLHALTWGEYLPRFVADRRGVSDRTKHCYESHLKHHLIPAIGHIRVDALRKAHLVDLIDGLAAKGLAPATQRVVCRILWPAITHALDEGALAADPRRGVARPQETPVRKRPALTVEHTRALRAASDGKGPLVAAFVWFLTDTGARPAEILGLQWGDLDLDAGRARIERNSTLRREDGKLRRVLGPVKSDNSKREVFFSAATVARLRALQAAQAKQALASGRSRPEALFVTRKGRAVRYEHLYGKVLKPLFSEAGLPEGATPYACRRGVATQLHADGLSAVDVAATLGNTTEVTLKHYLRPADSAAKDAAERLKRLLG